VDTCTPELLREAKRRADEARRPYTVHTSQSVVEFNEMLQRHGMTPIAWLNDLGVLGENTVLGHAIIVGGSSWTNYPAGDVEIMAESGCSVAHAVWVFARRGVLMESFALYRKAGINVALGTDTNPQSVIEAMRWAAICSKIVERNTESATAADAFDAATLGGARALGRDDLGRIAPGATADLVLWKAASWAMTPLRDPVKNIVYNATAEDVDRVYVGGRLVVDKGRVLAADEAKILADLQAGGERMWPRMKQFDWAGRSADELSPQTYREWTSGHPGRRRRCRQPHAPAGTPHEVGAPRRDRARRRRGPAHPRGSRGAGVDVCRRVRARPTAAPPYLILVTSLDSKENVVAGLEAGADDYMTKPFNPDEVRARVAVGGRIVTLQRSLADRVKELETALAEVQHLQGLLPMCAWCKRIRNEGQYWERVDTYIAARTKATFTHGICPDCRAQLRTSGQGPKGSG
jgi:hypothetical protein